MTSFSYLVWNGRKLPVWDMEKSSFIPNYALRTAIKKWILLHVILVNFMRCKFFFNFFGLSKGSPDSLDPPGSATASTTSMYGINKMKLCIGAIGFPYALYPKTELCVHICKIYASQTSATVCANAVVGWKLRGRPLGLEFEPVSWGKNRQQLIQFRLY